MRDAECGRVVLWRHREQRGEARRGRDREGREEGKEEGGGSEEGREKGKRERRDREREIGSACERQNRVNEGYTVNTYKNF